MSETLGTAILELGTDDKGLDAGLSKAEGKTTDWVGKVSKIVGALAIAAGIAKVGQFVFDAGMQMDEAMDTLAIKTGAVGPALDALNGSFKAVFTSVPTDAKTAADAIGELNRRTGMTGDTLEVTTRLLLEFSRMTGTEATANAGYLTRVMGDWGLSNEQAAGTLDKLFVAGQKTGVSVDALMQKVVQFGAPLRLMGFTIDESIALFAKWEKEGVNAELVMGSLRIAAGKFAKESEESDKVIKGGVPNLAEAADKMKGLKDQLQLATMKQKEWTKTTSASTKAASNMKIADLTKDIKDLAAAMALGEDRTVTVAGSQKTLKESLMETFAAIKNNTNASEALALGMSVFGARAGPDMVAAIREGRFEIDDLTAALGKTEGAIWDTAAATMDFPEKLTMVTNKLSVAFAPLGLAVMDVIGTLIDDLGPTIDTVGVWLGQNMPAAIETAKGFFANAMPVIGSAIGGIWQAVLLAKDKFTEYWPMISAAIMGAWTTIQPILQGLADFFTNRIMPAIAQVITWVQTNWPMISTTIQQGYDVVKGIIDQVVAVFGNVGTSMTANAGFVQAAWQKIQTLISDYLAGIWGVIQSVLGIIQAFIQGHGAAIQAALMSAWSQIQAIVLLALDVMNATIVPFFKGVAAFLQEHSTEIQHILSGAWDVVSNLIQGALDLIQGVLTVAMDLLSGNWEKAWEDVKTTIGQVWGHIESILKTGLEAAGNLIGPFIDTALRPFRDAFDGISRAISGVIQWIKDMATALSNISLPDWLTPGSPTPFELGLLGIGDAMRGIGNLTPSLDFGSNGVLALVGEQGPSGGGNTFNDTFNITINAPGGDPAVVRGAVMDGLATARAKGLR